MFAVQAPVLVGEEFGLFGSVAVLLGFVIILWRGIRATLAS